MAGGGQPGNTNASKGKPWQQAIERALRKRSRTDQLEALDEIAEAFLDNVKVGDIQSFKELGDRLDGKAHQSMDASLKGSITVTLENADADA